MATILDQRHVIDGYDVRFLTAGQAHVLHFRSQPDETALADALDAFERRMMNEIEQRKGLREEGEHGLFDQ
jgi:hypothetical protein